MSSPPARKLISVPCPSCHGSRAFQVDISDFHDGRAMTLNLTCLDGHHMQISINGGVMIDPPSILVQTDIQKYPDVPQDIRDTIEEANLCLAFGAPIGGASLVRTALDLFLYALHFRGYTGNKVRQLQAACRLGSHQNLRPRISEFFTISGVAGAALHAPSNRPQFTSEWMGHLSTVEGAVKTHWPRRV